MNERSRINELQQLRGMLVENSDNKHLDPTDQDYNAPSRASEFG